MLERLIQAAKDYDPTCIVRGDVNVAQIGIELAVFGEDYHSKTVVLVAASDKDQEMRVVLRRDVIKVIRESQSVAEGFFVVPYAEPNAFDTMVTKIKSVCECGDMPGL